MTIFFPTVESSGLVGEMKGYGSECQVLAKDLKTGSSRGAMMRMIVEIIAEAKDQLLDKLRKKCTLDLYRRFCPMSHNPELLTDWTLRASAEDEYNLMDHFLPSDLHSGTFSLRRHAL
jgi:hypothetical protein